MGLMLETLSERLLAPRHGARPGAGQGARAAPQDASRSPASCSIPFTTGLLIGIGETPRERVDTLVAIRDLHERYGHIQEVIVQNFRAKPRIPMRDAPEPSLRRALAHHRGGAPRARART